jgi:signal transduction histidine kinase
VLILVSGARDGALTRDILAREQVRAELCSTMTEVCACIREGAAVALLGEEVLTKKAVQDLLAVLADQPEWSDFPLLVFGADGRQDRDETGRRLDVLGNVTVLSRPIQVRSMVSAVLAAIRVRSRQYDARRAIDARDAFLAMLSHELRNPLGAIRLAVTAIERKSLPESQLKEFRIIERQCNHLGRLVDDLLDVARLTHGKFVVERRRVNIVEVVRSAFETFQMRAAERQLASALRVDEPAIWIQGDRHRLEQVFANLLSNAMKYTPPGGHIGVEIAGDDQYAVISVTDDGVGLAPEMVDRVFDTFTQVDDSIDRSEGGIGIGLSLVRGIVTLHNGEVVARSEGIGRGCTFRVQLPRLEAEAAEAVPVDRTSSPRVPAKRVVVVEDNEDIRALMKEMLEDAGHDVTCAENGSTGLAQILSLAPDVAFVDIGLPEIDGFEVARQARAAGSSVHLVALTGYGQADDREKARRAGFDQHLTKPVGGEDVVSAILRASAGS